MHPLKVLHIVILLITFGFQCFLTLELRLNPQKIDLQSTSTISNKHNLELFRRSLHSTSTLGNCPYKFVWYLESRYLKHSLCRTIFFFGPFIFIQGCFPSAISNFFNFIHSDVEIIHSKTLIKCLSSHISTQQHVGQAKPNVKGLGKKCQALKDLERRLSNRAVCYLASRSQLVFNLFSKKIKVSQVFFCCP